MVNPPPSTKPMPTETDMIVSPPSSDVLMMIGAFFCGGFLGGLCGAVALRIVEGWFS